MSDGLDATSWAVAAFADADLGDLRRTQRLVQLAHALAQRPGAALPEACGSGALRQAASRLFTNADLAPDAMRQSPMEATSSRLNAVPIALAGQETTAANWTHGRVTAGLGPLGHPACPGLLVPTPVAIPPERVPLGLFAQQVGARDPDDLGKRARRQPLSIRQKASHTWLHRLDAVSTARDGCPTTPVSSGGEREAEVDGVLAAPRPAGVARLRRASWQRWVNAPPRSVGATVTAQPVAAQLRLHVPRRGPQPAREAPWAWRYGPLTFCPPPHRKAAGVPAVTLWAVPGCAGEPPAAGEPIAWLLLTTGAVETVDDAIARVQWSACRGGMEVGPRMVQSGWRLEARPCQKAERLRRALAR